MTVAADPTLAPVAMLTENVQLIDYQPEGEERIRISAQVTVDRENPVFMGHYPGLPVFPGVCQIDCVHRTVHAAARVEGVAPVLTTVSTARFLSVVAPYDEIRIETVITRMETEWKVIAVLRGAKDPVARVGLRYRLPRGGTS